MKQIMIIFLIGALFLLLPVNVFGLNTPEVSNGHGEITLCYVNNIGWIAGGELGISDDLAIVTDVNDSNYNRTGLKLQLNPELAGLLGVTESKLFLGINPAWEINDNMRAMAEFDIYLLNGRLAFDLEVGLKFDLTQRTDIRAGSLSTVTETETTNRYQLGLAYLF